MEWVTEQYLQEEDNLEALNEAQERLGDAYYLGIARDEAGQLGVGIMDLSENKPNPPVIQFVPVADPADLAWKVRVYSEVYGHLAGNLSLHDLTPRGAAIVACKLFPGGVAIELATQAGIDKVLEAMGTPDGWDALEARLAEIKYTVLKLSIPAEARERLLSLPESIRKDLGIVTVRPVK